MKIAKLTAAHFSPTGSTAKIAELLGRALCANARTLDLSAQVLEEHAFGPDDYLLAAVPVFSGRVPGRAVEALKLFSGNGARCVSVAVFGNRAVDDALLELNDVLGERGFKVIASGAFAAQHSMLGEIGAGRPDAGDVDALNAFAKAILDKIAAGELSAEPLRTPQTPGNRPYKEVPPGVVVPLVTEACIECGECAARCPVSAIPASDFHSTAPDKCLRCMRCIKICPTGARILPPPYLDKLSAYLRQFTARVEAQVYL